MKNRLQYVYSIIVFLGVLTTAYSMLITNKATIERLEISSTGEPLRVDASVDPAISNLLATQEEILRLNHIKKKTSESRTPSEFNSIKQ